MRTSELSGLRIASSAGRSCATGRAKGRARTIVATSILAISPCLAAAKNLVENPEINDSTAGWSLVTGTSIDTSTSDADSCPESLALDLDSAFFMGAHIAEAVQSVCLLIEQGESVYARLAYLSPAAINGVRIAGFSNTNCTSFVGATNVVIGGPTGSFNFVEGSAIVPAGAHSVQVSVFSGHTSPHTLLADRVFFGTSQQIAADDFEGGNETCRWSP